MKNFDGTERSGGMVGENKQRKSSYFKWIMAIVAVIAVVLFFVFPTKYYIELPGSAESLKGFVTVDEKTDKDPGNFMLTTVGIKKGTPLTLLISKFSSYQEVISKENLMGKSNDKDYNRIQKYFMDSSVNHAIEVAYKTAGEKYTLDYKGIYVMSIAENSNLNGKISVGDTIEAIDGQSFQSANEFVNYIQKHKRNETVNITYLHADKKNTLKTKLVSLPNKKAGLGITLVDHTEMSTKIPVAIDAGNIGGPSAGFMFALEIYQLLTEKDLRKGLEIAGTGEMYPDGTIGRIGGIDKKVVAADKAGADIFFAPDDEITKEMRKQNPNIKTNYKEAKATAKKIKTDMEIVPVKNFDEALAYLKTIK